MNLITYQPASATPHEFIAYWSDLYPKQDDVVRYTPNIGSRDPNALRELFLWKFGKRFQQPLTTLDTKIIPRLSELDALPDNFSADEFLRQFSEGGAILRIFLLHCCSPNRFPIYDQHVHRAMSMAKSGECQEIEAWSDKKKITVYLQDYLTFHRNFSAFNQRSVDQALWAFGKFIKTTRLPGGCRHRH